MTINTAFLQEARARGLSLDDIIALAATLEGVARAGSSQSPAAAGQGGDGKQRSAAAERMARYRRRRIENGLEPMFRGADHMPDLLARDGGACVYCGERDLPFHVDHMIPISQGGTDDLENLALACRICNCKKSGRTPQEAGMSFVCSSAEDAFENYCSRTQANNVRPNNSEHVREQSEQKTEFSRARVLYGEDSNNISPLNTSCSSPRGGKRERKTKIPEGWKPSSANWERAAAKFGEAGAIEQLERFTDYWLGNGKPMADWNATWRNWVRRSDDFAAKPSARAGPRPSGMFSVLSSLERKSHVERNHSEPEILPPDRGAGPSDRGPGGGGFEPSATGAGGRLFDR